MRAIFLGLSLCSCSLFVNAIAPDGVVQDLSPVALSKGDLDGDGDLDLVTISFIPRSAQSGSPSLVLSLLRNREGVFSAESHFFEVEFAQPLEFHTNLLLVDIDRDEDLDVVTPIFETTLRIFLNDGSGQFSFSDDLFILSPQAISTFLAQDLDGDGLPEIIIGHRGDPGEIVVFHNEGGRFEAPQSSAHLLRSLLAGDFNGDSSPDLVVLNETSRIELLFNDGTGNLQSESVLVDGLFGLSTLSPDFDPSVVGDFNGDQTLDIAVGLTGLSSRTKLPVLFNNGAGLSFSSTLSPEMPVRFPRQAVAGDIDSDGDLDLVMGGLPGAGLQILSNNGSGVFRLASFSEGVFFPSEMADIEGDGDLDIVCLTSHEQQGEPSILVFLNDGAGLFPTRLGLTAGIFFEEEP